MSNRHNKPGQTGRDWGPLLMHEQRTSAREDERAEIWRTALAVWPAWQSYEDRTDRDLEMLVLEKV